MPREFTRSQRLSDFLKRELANIIQQEVKDPRIGMISISDVEVSRDNSRAKVYFTSLNVSEAEALNASAEQQKAQYEKTTTVLNKAAGFLRSVIAKQNPHLRQTPRLHFYYDHSIQRGSHLTSLIENLSSKPLQPDSDSHE